MFRRSTKSVDVRTAHEMTADDGWLIVDVRTQTEYRDSSVPGSVHYALESLNGQLSHLKGKKVLAICRSGSRSRTAVNTLSHNGIEARNVSGGMIAWTRAGLPVRKGR